MCFRHLSDGNLLDAGVATPRSYRPVATRSVPCARHSRWGGCQHPVFQRYYCASVGRTDSGHSYRGMGGS